MSAAGAAAARVSNAAAGASNAGQQTGVAGLDQQGLGSELCNGLDDDGDGAIDNGLPPTTCGLGACQRTVPGCKDGRAPSCVEGKPSAERCNSIDDDCDGYVDEGLVTGVIRGPFSVDVAAMERLVFSKGRLLAFWKDEPRWGRSPLWVASLDLEGRVLSPPNQPLSSPVSSFRVSTVDQERCLLTYCGAHPDPVEYQIGAALFDSNGQLLTEQPVLGPAEFSCVTVGTYPAGRWTGQRYLFAGINGSSAIGNGLFEVFYGTADKELDSLSFEELHSCGEAWASPSFAQTGAVVALVAVANPDNQLRGKREIVMHFWDTTGLPLRDPQWLSGAEQRWYHPRVAVGADGAFLVLAQQESGRAVYRARIAADGSVLEPLTPAGFDTTDVHLTHSDDLLALPGGGFVFGSDADYLVALDDHGELNAKIGLDARGTVALAAVGSEVYVAHSTPSGPAVSVLGCKPE